MMVYVYIDSTIDNRPFYVGKGLDARIKRIKRNQVHSRISKKYGLLRRVVFETLNDQWASEREIELIQILNTYVGKDAQNNAWGANLTKGGEGATGFFPNNETRKKMSLSKIGNTNAHGNYRQKRSPLSSARKLKISRALCGKHRSDTHCQNISKSLLGKKNPKLSAIKMGKKLSEKHAQNAAESHRGKLYRCSNCGVLGHNKRSCANE